MKSANLVAMAYAPRKSIWRIRHTSSRAMPHRNREPLAYFFSFLPAFEMPARLLDLSVLMGLAGTRALVVAGQQQDELVAVSVKENAQQDLARGWFGPRVFACLAQDLLGILVDTKLDQPAPKVLAEVRPDHIGAEVPQELVESSADRAALHGRQRAHEGERRLVTLVELYLVGRAGFRHEPSESSPSPPVRVDAGRDSRPHPKPRKTGEKLR